MPMEWFYCGQDNLAKFFSFCWCPSYWRQTMGLYWLLQSLARKASSTEKLLEFYRLSAKNRVSADFWFCSSTKQKLQKVLWIFLLTSESFINKFQNFLFLSLRCPGIASLERLRRRISNTKLGQNNPTTAWTILFARNPSGRTLWTMRVFKRHKTQCDLGKHKTFWNNCSMFINRNVSIFLLCFCFPSED